MRKSKIPYLLTATLIFFAFGCGGQQKFLIRPAPDISRFNRVAVFPMENLSGFPAAGSRVTAVLTSELYNSHLVDVVEPGEVQQFILRSRIRVAGQLDLDTIQEASRQLNADGIVFGSVNEYEIVSTDLGELPAVSVTLRVVDASNGDIVWAVTHSLQGDFKESVFGIGRVSSVGRLSEFVIADMVEALGVAMYPDERRLYAGPVTRPVKKELKPIKPTEEPVLPLAPTTRELEAVETEKQRAHGAVMQEWEAIKGLSE